MTLLLLLVISGSIPELPSKDGDLFTGHISIFLHEGCSSVGRARITGLISVDTAIG